MNAVDYTLVIRLLREYYNEAAKIINRLNDEDISLSESEAKLIELDEEYAKKIVKVI